MNPTDPSRAITIVADAGGAELRVSGRVTLAAGREFWRLLQTHLRDPRRDYRVDLTEVETLDGACAAMLLELKSEVVGAGGSVEFSGASPDVGRLLGVYTPRDEVAPKPPPQRAGIFHQLGTATVQAFTRVGDVFAFIGDFCVSLGHAIRSPRSVNWADVGHLMERAGADGVPIVVLINFLVGVILAYLAAGEFAKYGADIFVANLVGIGMARELGPLMTAIIVCGRSGAAFAAELGTMKVSEEIDALRTLGQDPVRFLVLPRMLALILMVPILTLLGDIVGCVGGLLIAMGELDLTSTAYLNQLQGAVGLWDVGGGLIKSVVFAIAITAISCQRGLATRGGAAGVGSSTTSAVVTILFALVALDTVFSILFAALGI